MTGVHPSHSQHPTEYDYDAPLSEAGDITDRYHALRDVIGKVSARFCIVTLLTFLHFQGSISLVHFEDLKNYFHAVSLTAV